MTRERFFEIEFKNSPITKEELEEGWHFCSDWDGMLVGPNTPESEVCLCKNNTK